LLEWYRLLASRQRMGLLAEATDRDALRWREIGRFDRQSAFWAMELHELFMDAGLLPAK